MCSEASPTDLPSNESAGNDHPGLQDSDLSRYWLAAVIESADDAIISKTLEGVITSWNRGAERIFGYTAAEAVGQPVAMLIPDDQPDEEPRILARLRRGERIEHYETVRRRKDGTLIHISLTVSPIRGPGGRIIGASKIARDITERRQAEAERERLYEREQEARRAAEEASRLKDEFLATVSHELRTPLTSILGYSRLLNEGALEGGRVSQALEAIERNARAQAQIVDDVLEVSRITMGKVRLDLVKTHVAPAVEAAIQAVRPAIEAKGIHLRVSIDPSAGAILADTARLQQIAWNLLSNAVKFTPPGGYIDVGIEEVEHQVKLTVTDSGIGIAPEFLPFVFDRFRQADSSITRTYGGLGLGLALVRYLAEMHGGTARASSSGEGFGATFTVAFPVAETRSTSLTAPVGDVSTESLDVPADSVSGRYPVLQGFRVLIVEDEADTREMLELVFDQCGAEVKTAASAEEALEVFRNWKPAVMVCDIGMPREDGYSLIRRVRAVEAGSAGPQTPALALTGYARAEDRSKALSAGYQMHVAKPVDPVELTMAVASLSGASSREPN